jgi:hypothetical protein
MQAGKIRLGPRFGDYEAKRASERKAVVAAKYSEFAKKSEDWPYKAMRPWCGSANRRSISWPNRES